jgi:chain length determinant protein (polysaccharide antigen chain regulator)
MYTGATVEQVCTRRAVACHFPIAVNVLGIIFQRGRDMEEQREQQPHHVSSQAYSDACSEDEINLLDLWRVLVRQWKVICAITGLSVLGAVAYVLLATPVYEAQAVVRPPESKYVEALNIPGISQISSADIFAKFTGNLKSSSLRQQFVEENPQFSSLRNNEPQIKEGAKNEAGSVFLSLQGNEAKLVADWMNGFILLSEKRTIDDFFDTIEVKIANQKKEIEKQLQIGRDFASQRRLDRIALLVNQIVIARASKIFDRQIYGYSVAKESQKFGVTVDTLQGPMYMRGVKELTAEKEELERRKDDEPFIAGFRDKQESLAQLDAGLKQLQAARTMAHAVTVDQPAIEAKRPVKPSGMRVLALSIVLGVITGIFTAFWVNLVQEKKAQTKG